MRLIQVVELSLGWDDFEGVVKTRNVPSLPDLIGDFLIALGHYQPTVLQAVLTRLRRTA